LEGKRRFAADTSLELGAESTTRCHGFGLWEDCKDLPSYPQVFPNRDEQVLRRGGIRYSVKTAKPQTISGRMTELGSFAGTRHTAQVARRGWRGPRNLRGPRLWIFGWWLRRSFLDRRSCAWQGSAGFCPGRRVGSRSWGCALGRSKQAPQVARPPLASTMAGCCNDSKKAPHLVVFRTEQGARGHCPGDRIVWV